MAEKKSKSCPPEIQPSVDRLRKSLDDVEKILEPFLNGSILDVQDKMTCLEKAKVELVSLYAINSLFWMYLCTQGVDTKEHPIKHELARIQQYMRRMKQITDREKAAKLDKSAAKRFINSALWDRNQKGETSKKRKATSDDGGVPNKK
ncbi:Nuclear nucleic acid-binding protein C1D [Holothuria leucospilota]|uniref:Nuclear nucleic acid-binding protein C1D n=1 Tax=Holothuria leucospilota TaxID=206669 RepID=A0A9Q1HFG7_HOLLE|nr:Nuclear nucleic acid-binding protein C1D [Holothuria leucospilota]